MNRLLALACALSLASSLSAATTTVESGNTLGFLRVDISTNTEALIAIPWLGVATTDTDIKVTDVVKTANLTAGDQLFYYDTTSKKYQVWQLNDSKEWVAATSVSDDEATKTAGEVTKTLARGNALLLKRNTKTEETSVYLYGQVPTSTTPITTTMAQGSTTGPAYTLLAPPSVDDTDLNTGATWANVNDGDMIVLSDSTVLTYRNDSNNTKKWCKVTGFDETTNKDTIDTAAAKITAGQGAWYVSAKGATTAATVTWQAPTTTKE